MYSGSSSPVFDAPDFPAFRRVRPLPKRRRTTADPQPQGSHHSSQATPPLLSPTPPSLSRIPQASNHPPTSDGQSHFPSLQGAIPIATHVQGGVTTNISIMTHNPLAHLPAIPINLPLDVLASIGVATAAAAAAASAGNPASPGSNTSAEDLLSQADAASARMTLQNYYMPMLSNLLGAGGVSATGQNGSGATPDVGSADNARGLASLSLGEGNPGTGSSSVGPPPLSSPNNSFPNLTDMDSMEFGVQFAAVAAAAAAAGVALGALPPGGANGGSRGGQGGGGHGELPPLPSMGVDQQGRLTFGGVPLNVNFGSLPSSGSGFNFGSSGMGAGTGRTGDSGREGRYDDEDSRDVRDRDGDYVDHLQQPGNNKKRKVPANAGGSPHHHHGSDGGRSSPSSFNDDEPNAGSGFGRGRRGEDDDEDVFTGPSYTRTREYGVGQGPADGPGGDGGGYERPSLPGSKTAGLTGTTLNSFAPTPTLLLSDGLPPLYPPPAPYPGQMAQVGKKRGKLKAVFLASLQHKEMLKARKKQLATVLGALQHGDTLALDQALSATYPLLNGGGSGEDGVGVVTPKARKSRRRKVWLVRVAAARKIPPHPDGVRFPTCEFSYASESATADRLVATKEEAAMLRSRFEAELQKQSAKAAKLAASGSKPKGNRGKRERLEREKERVEKAQKRRAAAEKDKQQDANSRPQQQQQTPQHAAKATKVNAGRATDSQENISPRIDAVSANNSTSTTPPSTTGGGKSKGKKKKRSALANASNPHHLRNYVPSRLPHGGDSGGQHNARSVDANTMWPLPMRFLSADLPPSRKQKKKNGGGAGAGVGGGPAGKGGQQGTTPLVHIIQPQDEWICPFCEYALFYGDERTFRRAVRNRKKILKRRRRARERAAAAASGVKKATTTGGSAATAAKVEEEEEDYDDDYDETGLGDEYGGFSNVPPPPLATGQQKGSGWKGGTTPKEQQVG